MKAKRGLWTLMAILLTALTAAAQITITQGSFQGPGFSYTSFQTGDLVTVNVGQSGANRTWTIGEYPWSDVIPISFVAPASTPYGGSFPTATRATFYDEPGGPEGDSYTFERITSTAYQMLGSATTDCTQVYAQPVLLTPLPLNYQASWATVMRFVFEPFPGFSVSVVDSGANMVDGWGTVNTPYGSYACLRVFTHTWVTTTITGLPPQMVQFVSYTWVDSRALGVASIMSDDDVIDPNFTEGYVNISQSGVAVEPVRGPVAERFAVGQNYPNPFNPVTVLPVTLAKSTPVTLDIYDANGRLLSREEFALPVGTHNLPVDGSAWASGTYFARVHAGDAAQTVRMQLVK